MEASARLSQNHSEEQKGSEDMRGLQHSDPRLAVVDVETTGFSQDDRIVEFACVTVVNGAVVEEYETLIQPGRDPGPVHVHGITPEMLQSAPRFEEVAGDIATRLDGAVLVAHNISFDVRMLCQEATRLDGAGFDPGEGMCTYRLTNQKLALAAAEAGLPEPNHTALVDARTVAALVDLYAPRGALRGLQAAAWTPTVPKNGVTMRRPDAPPRRGSLHQAAAQTHWPGAPEELTALYLDALDRCLDDGVLEDAERDWLDDTARALGLSETGRAELHKQYYKLLKEQILADGIVTGEEQQLAEQIAAALALGPTDIRTTERTANRVELKAGMNVCFTGTALINGVPANRGLLEKIATLAGFKPLKSVTKKCDLLVAADPLSQSGKARTARERGIPIISIEDFIDAT